jgi:hypothetical protein
LLTFLLQGNPRSVAIRAVAKANNVDLEIVETEPAKGVSDEYLKINKLGQVPTFVGADGYTLHECIAIAIYSKWKLVVSSTTNTACRLPCYDEKNHSVIPVLTIRVDFIN